MAGKGKAPKDPEARRNRVTPTRGEWSEVPKLSGLTVPDMPPADRPEGWLQVTADAWNAWWSDGVALTWAGADMVSVRQLAVLFDELERMIGDRGFVTLAAEVRQRMDGLGLTPKGRQDRRLRYASDDEEKGSGRRPRPARYQHLRSVPDAVEGT